jgi:hypothetical protein
VGYRIDAEQDAPRVPLTTYDLEERPTVDISPPSADPPLLATWEQSKELVVGSTIPMKDESSGLRRKIWWITLALAASISAQIAGLAAQRAVPALLDRIHRTELTYPRVWKSGRSIASARALGRPVPEEIESLQREAEQAASSGDASVAERKLDEIVRRWRND